MTTPTDTLFSPPYSVYPAIPLTATPYPETAEWGLGQRETDPNALFTFENWYASVANDSFALYWGNSSLPVAQDVVTKIADRYNLSIPKTKIREGESDVFGRVTRAASGQQADGFPQKYLVKTLRPGGLTFWASEQYHRGLFLTIESFPEGSIINQANTRNGLWCQIKKYENMRKNDTITLAYGATTIEHVVSPAEAAGPGPIRMFISQQLILQGNQLGPVGVAFMVRDVVNNFSGEKYAYSKPYILNSELDLNLLRPPIFLLNGVRATAVDLDQSSTARFEARVILPDDPLDPSPANRIVLILTVTQKTEYGESTRTVRMPAVKDNNLGGETVAIGNDVITSLTDATIRMAFEWQAADGTLLNRSGSTVVRVVGTAPLILPAPAFDNKSGPQTIAPEQYPNGAVVVVAYRSMSSGQIIRLNWMFASGTSASIPVQMGSGGGTALFAITAQLVAQSMGQLISLSYEVTTGTNTVSSESQVLTVRTISTQNFPQALINGLADNSTLNLSAFSGNATLALSAWPLISAGQSVWITSQSAGVAALSVLQGYVVTSADVIKGLVNVPVSRAWLEKLATNAAIKVEVAVTLDGSATRENAVAFKSTSYNVIGQFRIDQGAMNLSGVAIKNPGWGRTGLSSIGNSASRVPSGGVGPYYYNSNNPRVASVDAGGFVTGNVNGSATITVSDRNGSSVSYPVYVSNVYTMVVNDNLMNWATTIGWAASIRGVGLMDAAIYDVLRIHGAGAPVFSRQRWTSSNGSGNLAPFIVNNPNAGAVALQNINTQLAGVCLVPLY